MGGIKEYNTDIKKKTATALKNVYLSGNTHFYGAVVCFNGG